VKKCKEKKEREREKCGEKGQKIAKKHEWRKLRKTKQKTHSNTKVRERAGGAKPPVFPATRDK
jgi:hypothetical protein